MGKNGNKISVTELASSSDSGRTLIDPLFKGLNCNASGTG